MLICVFSVFGNTASIKMSGSQALPEELTGVKLKQMELGSVVSGIQAGVTLLCQVFHSQGQ